VEGYLKVNDNNIPINEDIIRTDSEEDLNSKIEAIFDNNTIDGVLWMKTTCCGFKNSGITKDIKFWKNSR
jgi:hypothetical protein